MYDAGLLFDGPSDAPVTLALAHGAGVPMDSPFMAVIAEALGARSIRVARFEFPYMAARRTDGKKRPPDRAPVLLDCWRRTIERLGDRPLAIGGKSLGGRMASLIADQTGVLGLVCLGYPFHPPGRPEKLRTAHLEALRTPCLIVQGERDPFGAAAEVPTYRLPPSIRVVWAPDGDHNLTPRKASGRSAEDNWALAASAVADFLLARVGRP